jgi:Putative peptidoglycan binding domain
MTIGKELAQFATYSVAMAAAVALCLWVLFVPLRIDRLAGAVPEQKLAVPEQKSGDLGRAGLPLVPGDCGPLVTQVQGKLIKNGYSVATAGADGNFNDNTLTALGAFQDNNALPVQPKCDQQCWTALGLSQPGSVWGVIEAALVGGIVQSPACGRSLANHHPAVTLPQGNKDSRL